MSAGSEGWDYFDVAAEVGVRGWGPTVAACFRQCALGVFDLIVPLQTVARTERREVGAQGESRDALLVNWMNELLYLHEVEGFAVGDVELPRLEGLRLYSVVMGEPLDPGRHPRGTLVKAATFHAATAESEPGRITARLALDI